MQEEIYSREEINHKYALNRFLKCLLCTNFQGVENFEILVTCRVLATRDLFNALKDHVAIVVERVEKGMKSYKL